MLASCVGLFTVYFGLVDSQVVIPYPEYVFDRALCHQKNVRAVQLSVLYP